MHDRTTGLLRGDFATWRASIALHAYLWEFETISRLLVRHDDQSAIDVEIILPRTHGVPWISGWAVKNIVSSRLLLSESGRGTEASIRKRTGNFVSFGDGAPVIGPKKMVSLSLFGTPANPRFRGHAEEVEQGVVTFEDAWLIPGDDPEVLARDVFTPHLKTYYDIRGREQPADWDAPNQVGFVTVKPGVRFLFALGVQPVHASWAELAFNHLRDALIKTGIGVKTNFGYGRFRSLTHAPIPPHA